MYEPKHRAHEPKHRAYVPERSDRSAARCISRPGAPCRDPYCPRHRPGMYAEAMARHATDSL